MTDSTDVLEKEPVTEEYSEATSEAMQDLPDGLSTAGSDAEQAHDQGFVNNPEDPGHWPEDIDDLYFHPSQGHPGHETRESEEAIHEMDRAMEMFTGTWEHEGHLAAPEARRGYHLRWIASAARGKSDAKNWYRRYRQGWRPVNPDHIPGAFQKFPIGKMGSMNVIQSSGMVLCEIPKQAIALRETQQKRLRERQNSAMDVEAQTFHSQQVARFGETIAKPVEREEQSETYSWSRKAQMAKET